MKPMDSTGHTPKDSEERTYDRSALILAWLETRRWAHAHPDLRNHHQSAYDAFRKSFGIDLDGNPDPSDLERTGLHGLFLSAAASYESLRSPFGNYLCAPRSVSGFHQRYHRAIDQVEAPVRMLYLRLMLELIEPVWGDQVPCAVTTDQLRANGFPQAPAPDPVDYW